MADSDVRLEPDGVVTLVASKLRVVDPGDSTLAFERTILSTRDDNQLEFNAGSSYVGIVFNGAISAGDIVATQATAGRIVLQMPPDGAPAGGFTTPSGAWGGSLPIPGFADDKEFDYLSKYRSAIDVATEINHLRRALLALHERVKTLEGR